MSWRDSTAKWKSLHYVPPSVLGQHLRCDEKYELAKLKKNSKVLSGKTMNATANFLKYVGELHLLHISNWLSNFHLVLPKERVSFLVNHFLHRISWKATSNWQSSTSSCQFHLFYFRRVISSHHSPQHLLQKLVENK